MVVGVVSRTLSACSIYCAEDYSYVMVNQEQTVLEESLKLLAYFPAHTHGGTGSVKIQRTVFRTPWPGASTPMIDDSEQFQDLLRQAQGGSNEAKNTLIESVRTYLLLVANHEIDPRLRQKVAASDVVQDACLIAAEKLDTFRGKSEAEFRGWLRQVLLNSLTDSRRKFVHSKKRQANREVVMGEELGVVGTEISPGASMIRDEEAERLQAALCRLPEHYRQVLELRSWQGLPFDQIGTQLGRSGDAAQKLWMRALNRLENELNLE